jgi:hypothetical protein
MTSVVVVMITTRYVRASRRDTECARPVHGRPDLSGVAVVQR